MEVDLERAVRDEEDVFAQKFVLDGGLEDVGEMFEFDDPIDAAAIRLVAAREMARVGLLAPACRDDEIPKPLGAGSRRDVERRVTPNRRQRQSSFVVASQRSGDAH